MKVAFWTYIIGQGLLVGAAMVGKMSIWISLIPTFALISVSAGVVCLLLLFEFMFNIIENCGPIGWEDKADEEEEYEEVSE